MATTTATTHETRIYFTLQSASSVVTRYITLPGMPSGTDYTTVTANFKKFRTFVLSELNTFIQPSNWRDDTGSTDASDDQEPYTTTDVQLEFYSVEKVRYDGQDD